MTQCTKVTRDALALSLKERAKLASRLLRSIDEPSQDELEALWIAEAESRVKACEQGLMKLIPYAEVKKKFEQRVRK